MWGVPFPPKAMKTGGGKVLRYIRYKSSGEPERSDNIWYYSLTNLLHIHLVDFSVLLDQLFLFKNCK